MKLLESIERSFRKGVVYPLLRGVLRNPASKTAVELAGVERMLVLRFDRIGDMLVTLPVLRALKRRAPHMQLAVLASKANAELVQNCGCVDEVLVLEKNWFKLLRQVVSLRRKRFDVIVNFVFNQTTAPAILANVIAPKGMKVGQGPDKYAFYFNRLVKVPRFERHMTEQLVVFVAEAFGIRLSEDELQQGIDVPDEARVFVDTWLRHNSLTRRSKPDAALLRYIVFNLSAGDQERGLSEEQAVRLYSDLSKRGEFQTVVLHAPEDEQMAHMLAERPEFKSAIVFRTEGDAPLAQLASLIGGGIAVVTPDTSVIHFASAMQTPVAGIYKDMEVEWGPLRVRNRVIKSEGSRPSSSINVADLVKEVGAFVEDVLREERHS